MLSPKVKMICSHLLSVSAISIVGAAYAQAQTITDGNDIENEQVNFAEVLAEINATLDDISQDVSEDLDETGDAANSAVNMTSAAIGNSFSAEMGGTTRIDNSQSVTQSVTSGLNITTPDGVSAVSGPDGMINITGRVVATSAAIGNSASVKIDDATNGRGAVSAIANDQDTNFAEFYSQLNFFSPSLKISNPGGVALEATSASIANSFNAEAYSTRNNGEFIVDTRQVFEGNSISDLDVVVGNVTGDVLLTSVAMANSASIETGGIASVSIDNCQTTDASVCIEDPDLPEPPPPPRPVDPSSYADVSIDSFTGNFELTNAAISNSLSVSSSTLPNQVDVDTQQYNSALTEAIANVDLGPTIGKVDITSVAIGNTVDIKTLTGGF